MSVGIFKYLHQISNDVANEMTEYINAIDEIRSSYVIIRVRIANKRKNNILMALKNADSI